MLKLSKHKDICVPDSIFDTKKIKLIDDAMYLVVYVPIEKQNEGALDVKIGHKGTQRYDSQTFI